MRIDICSNIESGDDKGRLVPAQALDSLLRATVAVYNRLDHKEDRDTIERIRSIHARFHGDPCKLDAHITVVMDTIRTLTERNMVVEFRIGSSEPSSR